MKTKQIAWSSSCQARKCESILTRTRLKLSSIWRTPNLSISRNASKSKLMSLATENFSYNFDKRIWEMHNNPKIKEWRDQGDLKKAIDKLRDDLHDGNFSFYFRKVFCTGKYSTVDYRMGEVSTMSLRGDDQMFSTSTCDRKSGDRSTLNM